VTESIASFTQSQVLSPGVAMELTPGPTRTTPDWDTPLLNWRSPGSGQSAAKQPWSIPWHHRSFSDMDRISTVNYQAKP